MMDLDDTTAAIRRADLAAERFRVMSNHDSAVRFARCSVPGGVGRCDNTRRTRRSAGGDDARTTGSPDRGITT